jgi:ABC-type antimicrobial peptide transport system permease subunit
MRGVVKSPFGGFLPALKVFDPEVALICVAVAGLIGVMSSLVPAMSASRTTIVNALRSTD